MGENREKIMQGYAISFKHIVCERERERERKREREREFTVCLCDS